MPAIMLAAQARRLLPRCKADSDLAARVKEIRAELDPDATPERLAERIRQTAEDRGRRRLTARVRRVTGAVA